MTPPKLLLAVSLALVGRTASAEVVDTDEAEPGYLEPLLQSGVGVGLTVGGGVSGFATRSLRNATSPLGGLWDLRAAFGTHTPLALEVGYVGTAMSIQSQLNPQTATLISTTFETDVRVNFAPHYLADPYVFAGLGWQRYTIDDPGFSVMQTGIANRADALEIPVGAGLSYRDGGFVADVRGTFRAVRDANLVLEQPELTARIPSEQRFAPMHNWEASLAVGYEF
jgi:hypothetical protein